MCSIKHLVLLFTFYGVIESKQFRSDYTYHQELDGWLKLHAVPGTWHEARQRCYMEGAVLASPVNADMQNALRSEMNKSSTECARIYVGVHSLFSKGYFYSLEGVPLSKMSVQWLPGQPDNAGNNEECIAYVDGRVADVNCSEVLPFLCYKKSTADISVTPCGTTDREYEFSAKTGSCYKIHKRHLNWADAFKACSAEGGYLAIINSREEAAVLKDMYSHHFANTLRFVSFIGIHDWDKDRTWKTIHGQTLKEAGYADWEKGKPNNQNGPGQYCGGITLDVKLFDLPCDERVKFLCEKDPNSLQDYISLEGNMSPLYRYIILLISFMAIECKQFRLEYTYYPSIEGRLKLHNIPANYKDARLLCDVEGATLASPSNEYLKNVLDSELNKAEVEFKIFTGVDSIFSKGYFYSIEGVPLGDMPLQWLPGEPDNAGGKEDCIAYTKGSVADVKCSELLPFVCYKKGKETPKASCKTIIGNQSTGMSSGCYKYHQEERTWPEAHKFCLASGGHLAIINSEQEARFIKQYLSTYIDMSRAINRIIYTGFYDWSGKGHWRTIQGQSLEEAGYANFHQGYPYIPVHGPGCGGIFGDAMLVSGECFETSTFLCQYKK
ncbi:macrophage mannose receptor 1-like [Maniola jurtina]|uniref:macrophage mannose receptor 1-like n=1 Tax=Maniola jurtina TaxID=191418 RepID=UPI001E685EDE|nr:macrophage mannose receptor 1-like [Maniola jurtina]